MPVSFSSSAKSETRTRGAGVTAVLGPTNTGKTHLAIERMLAHSSGMIGLPLRLLAREVYNKVVDRVGAKAVALITGEEKIKPPHPRFWVATVEAMPQDLDVAFLAVDEVQLGADFERGHVFTDRMLHRRGREETLVLGAATVRPMVERLLPGAHILSRPRLSQLTFAGERKLTRLQRRSAVVAFSAQEVYAIAELIRRQRGGAAVVLGALSPRTRNAQVEMYQSGDVEYLVATDAIGMGLNLDVEHVAFASDSKFDGYQFRRLNPAEFAQIAGRAGRATRDGTFGTTGRCPPFEPELVQALESHSFESLKVMQWRNSDLDFASLGALAASLAMVPQEQGLTRAPIAEDIQVLEHAARDEEVRAYATSRDRVKRLWEVCQVPDYRRISPATHTELVTTLFGFLMRQSKIPDDWFARQVAQADHADGDIDTLSMRIAQIRTWTFAANRPDWLVDPDHWQGVTRAVEDRLSDALHERLTERFVDRRTSVLMRRLRENTMLETEIAKSGDVMVEGHVIGRLGGFQFAADSTAAGSDAKALRAAAQKALAGEIDQRASRFSNAPDDQFVLASDGAVRWMGEPVGKLVAGDEALRPRIRIIADEQLTGASREAVQAQLDLWIKAHVEKILGPLFTLSAAEDVTGIARGIAFQIAEAFGVIERQRVAEDVKGLDQPARAALRKYGVRFGAYHVYLPALLKPSPRSLAVQLWALKRPEAEQKGLDDVRALAASGRTSFPADKEVQKTLYRTLGYRVCGERAVRVDILERLADLIRPALAWRSASTGEKPPGAIDGAGFTITPQMTSLTGSAGEDFASILRSLGYRMEKRLKPVETPPSVATIFPTAESADADAAGDIATPSPSDDGPTDAVASEVPAGEAAAGAVLASETQPVLDAAPPAVPTIELAQPEPDASPDADLPPPTLSGDAVRSGASAEAQPAEPEMIEVWRPGRPPEERRGDRRPARDAHRGRPRGERGSPVTPAQPSPSPVAADGGETAAPPVPNPMPSEGEPRPSGGRRGRPERDKRPEQDQKQAARPRPEARSRRERSDREQRRERGDRDRSDFAAYNREQAARNERREKPADPNSPFAKLAALKEQLEAAAKERR